MRISLFGGAGFVGLSIAEAALTRGHEVILFDRAEVPDAAQQRFAALRGGWRQVKADITDIAAIAQAIPAGTDAVVLGLAITADAARDAREPAKVLSVNLLGLIPVIERCREAGVKRIVNLSSAAVYGLASFGETPLREDMAADPAGLYGISKLAGEQVLRRLAGLWGLDQVSLRLSGAFGPWERMTGARDTLSPHFQILAAAEEGRPALLARPGLRDWIYGGDIAEAVLTVIAAERLQHRLYNVSSAACHPVLAFGLALQAHYPGFVCRLAESDEAPTIDLHADRDRAPLDVTRLKDDLGWTAKVGLANAVERIVAFRQKQGMSA